MIKKLGLGFVVFGLLVAGLCYAATPKTITLTEENSVSIISEVNGASIQAVLDKIQSSDPTKPLYLYLDTPGGSVFAGRRLVDYLISTNRDIRCISNTAISMGFVIMQVCPVRYVTHGAILMGHQIGSGMQGELNDLKAQIDLMSKLEHYFDSLIAARLHITLEEYTKKINPQYWTVGGPEAIADKEADDLVIVKCSDELSKKKTKLVVGGGFFASEVEINACPLL